MTRKRVSDFFLLRDDNQGCKLRVFADERALVKLKSRPKRSPGKQKCVAFRGATYFPLRHQSRSDFISES
jgi:hypothetical protein